MSFEILTKIIMNESNLKVLKESLLVVHSFKSIENKAC